MEFKFGGVAGIMMSLYYGELQLHNLIHGSENLVILNLMVLCLTAKFNSPPIFPAIQYLCVASLDTYMYVHIHSVHGYHSTEWII